jgi:protein SCO1/2
MKYSTVWLFVLSLLFINPIATANEGDSGAELPDNSVYHLESQWRDQHGVSFPITDLQGPVRLVAFVYTYCEHTCPVIIAELKSIIAKLPTSSRDNVVVTLVTLDPERDTVERVAEYMESRSLDDKGWQVLVGSADDVLSFAALFDVRYKPMGESDIAHSNVITLVDQYGVIRDQIKGLGQNPDKFVEQLVSLSE